ncbi:GNAT family N-acetyltransferase [Pediococcus argentinicus]|uniref:Acetyltransferase n=1 Tax=Pediococcus argentinicus TaxID=480391 RepID=A0A0R2NMJ6_9LACO|nr:GNAT family N-acetyltransferase [Pediococcus argentinicus]KRO25899.1 acetyltransferase [Pediococcus argentinicus]NKZ21892.1 GNAT family N-acetyltransferase [Pediococcus argentinicus]GEP19062.1 putative acetyltransferase [Pediococcus argentinicus]
MEIKMIKGATGPIYMDALEVRKAVFVEEQGISADLEFDENEDFFTYFVGYVDGKPVVTARTRRLTDDTWLVQRVATLKPNRKRGLARELFAQIEKKAKEQGIHNIKLHAQDSAQSFYFSMNYDRLGGPEMEAGIKHYWMLKVI